ncbi:uncharacterized protein LOC132559619 [Ylistrum balloti]|uniref:uncharacterized protein LOC132559619 n=1 Tax=Ylistrum balloti TaxID=509963 RepID=UPI002905B828|nr:uncharacterized protein LOC132559619 [Ylistrum balloti]
MSGMEAQKKDEAGLAIPREQTHILRLVIFLNELGSLALKERLIYEVFNNYIQNKKAHLQNKLPQAQFDKLFSCPACPHFNKLDPDTLLLINTIVFNLPRVSDGNAALLKSHLEGEGLVVFLSGHSDQIKSKKVLSKKQLGYLFPTLLFQKLDITLLSFLLFNLFDIKPTSSCFEQLPPEHHTHIGDDILRLRLYRNKVSHISTAGLNQERFDTFWKDISGALIRLLGVECKSRLDEVKHKSIDGRMLSEYHQLISQWYQDDLETNKHLDEIRRAVVDVGKSVGHREYQQRIWMKSLFEQEMKKRLEPLLRKIKLWSDQKHTEEQAQHALLFKNRTDLLRACQVLERDGLDFKTCSGSSLKRSASSIEPGQKPERWASKTHGKAGGESCVSKCERSATAQCSRTDKGRRRWTGPILYTGRRADLQQSEKTGTSSDADFICKVMQHTPTSSLDAVDLYALDKCSVVSGVVDLPMPRYDITTNGSQSSRRHCQRMNSQIIGYAATAKSTNQTITESDKYRREQKLERRKLRQMENVDFKEKPEYQQGGKDHKKCFTRPDTPVPFNCTRFKTSDTKPNKKYVHPPTTSHDFIESQEPEEFHLRQENKRWTTYPVRHDVKTGNISRDRRKSDSDVTPKSFISIQKQIQDRYGGEGLDFSEFTEKSSIYLKIGHIDEEDETSNEPTVQNQQSLTMTETSQKDIKPDMTTAKGVMSVLKDCFSKPTTRP